uniref:Uncharacterized protein n=1 Tax=Timema bartmani TaxID=61472 RepID=A0A7R9F205_9NEOP|nr:unnamed protein product [Timema bartmani]
MPTPVILMLLVAASSTIAFTKVPDPLHILANPDLREVLVNDPSLNGPEGDHSQILRSRRGVSVATTPARNTVISSSSSFPNGAYSGSISASGAGGGQGGSYSNGGYGSSSSSYGFETGSFSDAFPEFMGYYGIPQTYSNYPFHNPYAFMPFDFARFSEQYFRQLQALAQQHAYAQSSYGNDNFGTSSSSGNNGGLEMTGFGFNTNTPEYRFGGFGPGFFRSPEAFGGNSGSYSNQNVNEGFFKTPGNDENVGAFATANITPQGGHGTVGALPGLATRFSSDDGGNTPPNGNSFGVFTSSSSGSSDVNGKKTSYKTATSAINDNGKITVYTANDPNHV